MHPAQQVVLVWSGALPMTAVLHGYGVMRCVGRCDEEEDGKRGERGAWAKRSDLKVAEQLGPTARSTGTVLAGILLRQSDAILSLLHALTYTSARVSLNTLTASSAGYPQRCLDARSCPPAEPSHLSASAAQHHARILHLNLPPTRRNRRAIAQLDLSTRLDHTSWLVR